MHLSIVRIVFTAFITSQYFPSSDRFLCEEKLFEILVLADTHIAPILVKLFRYVSVKMLLKQTV